MRKKLKQVLSLLLISTLSFTLIAPTNKVSAATTETVETTVEDGVTYIIKTTTIDGVTTITTTNNSNDDSITYTISDDEIVVGEYNDATETTEATIIERNATDVEDTVEYEEESDDSSITSDDEYGIMTLSSSTITYNSKHKETWKNKLWYQKGASSTKDYLKIGSSATYRICTSSLSSTRKTECTKFTTAIDKSNTYKIKATATLGGALVTDAVTAILALSSFPPAALVTALFSTLGIAGTGGTYLLNSYLNYRTACSQYDLIKAYGTKL